MNDDPDPKEPNPSIEEIEVPLPDPPTMAEGEEVPSALSERETILKLHEQGYGMRKIAVAVGRDRKTVRRVLEEEGKDLQHPNPQSADLPRLPVRQSKLDSFRGSIRQKAEAHLTISRILREIQEDGYTGGRTVLAEYVRSLNLTSPPPAAKRRFETGIGEETQVDWSVYTVPIAGTPRRVHALLCVLAYSRYIHVGFYRDERQATLFEGLARAFDAFSGVTQRVVFDNMSTAVLARIGKDRKPLWHPRLLDFARHYGFQPFACRVRDPEDIFFPGNRLRSSLLLLQLRGSTGRAQNWASTIANRRIHGTTRRIPEEAWLSERDFLVKLPDTRFAVHEESVRQVGPDATISIRGTLFTVPHTLANQSVAVRLFAEHFEVLSTLIGQGYEYTYMGT